MIDKTLLEQLGWSKDLINEVNRIAGEIEDVSKKSTIIEESFFNYETKSGDTIHSEVPEYNSSTTLALESN